MVYTSEADGSGLPLKLILKWKETQQFHTVNVDVSETSPIKKFIHLLQSLVDREVNMNNTLRKAYTLKECIDLYTTREQLNEEDSWQAFKNLQIKFSFIFKVLSSL